MEVDTILNDRPLTNVSGDIKDDAAITPSLLPSPLVDPDRSYNEVELLTSRQRRLENIKVAFWMRWRSEYLLALRERVTPKYKATTSVAPPTG